MKNNITKSYLINRIAELTSLVNELENSCLKLTCENIELRKGLLDVKNHATKMFQLWENDKYASYNYDHKDVSNAYFGMEYILENLLKKIFKGGENV